MFEVAEAYEEDGAVSRQLAPLFLEFVGVRDGENVLMLVAALARCQRLWPKSRDGNRRTNPPDRRGHS